MKDALIELFNRDLKLLKKEIELYDDEASLWKIESGIKNSGGNLCLHLIGNLKTYVGNVLAQTNYERKREEEFSAKNIDRNNLFKEIDETIQVVNEGLRNITEEQFKGDFPIKIWNEETGMVFTLIHLHGHLNYHLGQINYHRLVLESEKS